MEEARGEAAPFMSFDTSHCSRGIAFPLSRISAFDRFVRVVILFDACTGSECSRHLSCVPGRRLTDECVDSQRSLAIWSGRRIPCKRFIRSRGMRLNKTVFAERSRA